MTNVMYIKEKPEWKGEMFRNMGGYVGEDDTTRVLCDKEFEDVLPWEIFTYIVFPHELCNE